MLSVAERRSGANLQKPTELVRATAARLPWAWDGLRFGVSFAQADNDGLRDIVNNIGPSFKSGLVWTRDDRGNPAISFNIGGTPYVGWPDSPTHDQPSTALTAYIRLKNTGAAITDGGALMMPYDIVAPWSTWGIQASSTDANKMYGSLSLGGVTEYVTPDTDAIPTTQFTSIFLRWRSGDLLTMDVLGERGNTLSTVTRAGALSGTIGYNPTWGIRVNANASPVTNHFSIYSQAMVWSRRLSDVELACLVADPFGWYSPRRETVAVAAPFPVGPGQAAPGLVLTGPGGWR